jgi:hypothetical protein
MTDRRGQKLPQARKEGLLIEMLPDEVLVYDLDRKKAHCLNQTAGLIWNHCDGQTSVEEMAIVLQKHSEHKIEEDVVWFGLRQLHKASLMEGPLESPDGRVRISRRELVKRIGLAVSIPLVATIVAPTASAALSCAAVACTGGPGQGTCSAPCNCIASVCQ